MIGYAGQLSYIEEGKQAQNFSLPPSDNHLCSHEVTEIK